MELGPSQRADLKSIVGTKFSGFASRGMDRCVSCWIPGQAGLLPDHD